MNVYECRVEFVIYVVASNSAAAAILAKGVANEDGAEQARVRALEVNIISEVQDECKDSIPFGTAKNDYRSIRQILNNEQPSK
jgi:hypothetical protein